MLLAAAATAFSACNKEVEIQEPEKTDGMTNVRFSAVVNDAETRATLTTEDELTFTAAWEEGEEMVIEALSTDADYMEEGTATWMGTYFDTNLPSCETRGEWTYSAYYPLKESNPFGNERVQNGNNYNSEYDIMKGDITYDDAYLGKDNNGERMVVPMSRLTSILYFHLTSNLNEALASATLTVEGGAIAAEVVSINSTGIFDDPEAPKYNSITLTFAEGTAPTADDFRLWFNILPAQTTGLTLTITTVSGKTATLSNTKGKTYAAGKLNKIVKSGLTWEDAPTPTAGAAYTWNLASGDLGITGSPEASVTKGTPALTWSAAYTWSGETKYFGNDNTKGVQIGKKDDACTSAVFTTSGYTDYIESIRINFSHAKDGESSASVKVGNVNLTYGGETSVNGTNTASYYTFSAEDLVKGDVEITLSNSSTKAIYLKSIEINPDLRDAQNLSFPLNSYSVELTEETFASPTLSGAITSVTYSSSDETVATVDNNGLVSLIKTGTTTITATAEASDEYQEGSASYELTVTPGPSSIADVIAASVNASVYTQGVVAQVNARGVIITDGTNNLSVYLKSTPNVVVGQMIKVSGMRSVYNNVPQIGNNDNVPVVTPGATGQTVVRTPLTIVTSANAKGYTSSEYVSLTGKLVTSSSYYNIEIEDCTTKGSLYQVVTSATYSGGTLASLVGEMVVVTGYVAGSTDSYLNIAAVDIEKTPYLTYTEPEAAGFAEDSQITIPVDANVSWTAAKGTDADNIIKSVSYDAEKVTVTFNANTGDEKSATIVITPGSDSGLSAITVTVTQSAYGEVLESVFYTLDGTITGGNSGYATESDITQNDISWKVVGNTTMSPWRIGGSSLQGVNRVLYSTTKLSKNVSKIEITHGAASSITVNSMTVIVASDASFNTVVSTLTPTFVANGTVTVSRPSGADWTNCFYKIIYNVSVSATSNKFVQFIGAEFTGK